MTPLLQQLPVLVGVTVGIMATYLTTAARDRVQWRRAQTTRWDESRMRAYAEYSEAVKRVIRLAVTMTVARGIRHEVVPTGLSHEEAISELSKASFDRSVRWEAVLLLGDTDTIRAARSWHECVWRLELFARGKLDGQDQWEDAVRRSEAARDAYYASARRDLGVLGGVVPPRLGHQAG